jgi:hypothetical protein
MDREHGGSPEMEDDGLTDEEREMLSMFEDRSLPVQERRDGVQEVRDLNGLLEAFEEKFPLEELFAVTRLTREEAANHRLRVAATKALEPIVALLSTIKDQTTVPIAEYDRLFKRYLNLSNAVGFINGDRTRHS